MARLVNYRFLWKRRWYVIFLCIAGVVVANIYLTRSDSLIQVTMAINNQKGRNGDQQNINQFTTKQQPIVSRDSRGKPRILRGNESRTRINLRSARENSHDMRGSSRVHASLRAESHDCESWCHRGERMSPPYNLTVVLLVRIYRDDLAGLSSREMVQWLFYLRYAGVEHVYVYDAYMKKEESQRHVLEPLVQSGYVTYVDWSAHNPYSMTGTQIAAYAACHREHGKLSKWHLSIDIDEYLFSPTDHKQNFLQRLIASYTKKTPDISQISFRNYLFLGKPLSDLTHPIFIERFRRRTHKAANDLVKSVYKPAVVQIIGVHHMTMRSGLSVYSRMLDMRMNHYWGARLQNWGEDTAKVINMTEIDYSMKEIVENIKICSECLGKDLLYVKRWN